MAYTYPDHQIDPKKKDAAWILSYTQAAWSEFNGTWPFCFYNGRTEYKNIQDYALGKQDSGKYKTQILGQDIKSNSWAAIDWSIPAIIPKYREIAIAKLMQRMYDIQAFAVDPLAKSEEDAYFDKMKVKLAMQEMAKRMGSELAESPMLKPAPGEPQDTEQLMAQMQFGFKHNMAMQAEAAISLTVERNRIETERWKVCADMFDYGCGGYKDWIDNNGIARFRAVHLDNTIVSPCQYADFRDAVHAGEVLEVPVVDLVPYFTAAQVQAICNKYQGRYGNPGSFDINKAGYYKNFKVLVLDFQFISWDTKMYKQAVDWRENLKITEATLDDYGNTRKYVGTAGEAEPKYIDQTKKVIYQTKWIIDTEFQYDYGKAKNQKRKRSNWWDTSLDYYLFAWNFSNGRFSGIMERLLPIGDNYAVTWYKLQNLTNKLIPYLINLDIAALENVNFGMGGKKFEVPDLIQLIADNFTSIYRSTDLLSTNPNYKPVSIESSAMMFSFKELYDRLEYLKQMIRDMSGLNEYTDGSTINPKNLNSTNLGMNESTNNALYLASSAEKNVFIRLCDAIVQKVQIAVSMGKVDGYARAMGQDTIQYFEVSSNIAMHEFGIFLEDAPDENERQQLLQELNIKDSQGLIEPADKIIVQSCKNLKQAAILLAYNVKKRKEELYQQELAKGQQIVDGQQKTAQMSEQMKQQTAQLLHQMEMEKLDAQMQWQYVITKLKVDKSGENTNVQAHAKVLGTQILAEAKTKGDEIKAKQQKALPASK